MFLLQFSRAFGKPPCESEKNCALFHKALQAIFFHLKQTELRSSRLFVTPVIGWCFPRYDLIGSPERFSRLWLAKCSSEPPSSVWLGQWSPPIITTWWTRKAKVLKLSGLLKFASLNLRELFTIYKVKASFQMCVKTEILRNFSHLIKSVLFAQFIKNSSSAEELI